MPRITNGMQHRYTQSSQPRGAVWNTVCNTGTSVMSTSSTISVTMPMLMVRLENRPIVREPPRGLSTTIGMFVEFLPPLDWY